MRLGEGGVVLDLGRIEDGHIGEVSGLEQTAVFEPEVFRRLPAELADRFGQRNDLFVADVLSEQPREIAIGARVGLRQQESALRRDRAGVGSKTDPRQGHVLLHVVFLHHEVDGVHAAAVLDHEIHGRQFGRSSPPTGHLGQRLAGQVFERLVLEADQEHVFGRSGAQQQVFPFVARRAHFLSDALPRLGVA